MLKNEARGRREFYNWHYLFSFSCDKTLIQNSLETIRKHSYSFRGWESNKSCPEALCGIVLFCWLTWAFSLALVKCPEILIGSVKPCWALLAVAGLSIKSATVGVHPAEVFMREHTWRWVGVFVQTVPGKLVSWPKAKHLPAQRADMLQHQDICFRLTSCRRPAMLCQVMRFDFRGQCSRHEDMCLFLFSFKVELLWHLQIQDCLLKNRQEEKHGD